MKTFACATFRCYTFRCYTFAGSGIYQSAGIGLPLTGVGR